MMRRFVFLSLFFVISSLNVYSKELIYNSPRIAVGVTVNNTTVWSDWTALKTVVELDWDNSRIKVSGKRYNMIWVGEWYQDRLRGQSLDIILVDIKGAETKCKFRVDSRGNGQLYISFGNKTYLYDRLQRIQ